jgi:hypothetical protein
MLLNKQSLILLNYNVICVSRDYSAVKLIKIQYPRPESPLKLTGTDFITSNYSPFTTKFYI